MIAILNREDEFTRVVKRKDEPPPIATSQDLTELSVFIGTDRGAAHAKRLKWFHAHGPSVMTRAYVQSRTRSAEEHRTKALRQHPVANRQNFYAELASAEVRFKPMYKTLCDLDEAAAAWEAAADQFGAAHEAALMLGSGAHSVLAIAPAIDQCRANVARLDIKAHVLSGLLTLSDHAFNLKRPPRIYGPPYRDHLRPYQSATSFLRQALEICQSYTFDTLPLSTCPIQCFDNELAQIQRFQGAAGGKELEAARHDLRCVAQELCVALRSDPVPAAGPDALARNFKQLHMADLIAAIDQPPPHVDLPCRMDVDEVSSASVAPHSYKAALASTRKLAEPRSRFPVKSRPAAARRSLPADDRGFTRVPMEDHVEPQPEAVLPQKSAPLDTISAAIMAERAEQTRQVLHEMPRLEMTLRALFSGQIAWASKHRSAAEACRKTDPTEPMWQHQARSYALWKRSAESYKKGADTLRQHKQPPFDEGLGAQVVRRLRREMNSGLQTAQIQMRAAVAAASTDLQALEDTCLAQTLAKSAPPVKADPGFAELAAQWRALQAPVPWCDPQMLERLLPRSADGGRLRQKYQAFELACSAWSKAWRAEKTTPALEIATQLRRAADLAGRAAESAAPSDAERLKRLGKHCEDGRLVLLTKVCDVQVKRLEHARDELESKVQAAETKARDLSVEIHWMVDEQYAHPGPVEDAQPGPSAEARVHTERSLLELARETAASVRQVSQGFGALAADMPVPLQTALTLARVDLQRVGEGAEIWAETLACFQPRPPHGEGKHPEALTKFMQRTAGNLLVLRDRCIELRQQAQACVENLPNHLRNDPGFSSSARTMASLFFYESIAERMHESLKQLNLILTKRADFQKCRRQLNNLKNKDFLQLVQKLENAFFEDSHEFANIQENLVHRLWSGANYFDDWPELKEEISNVNQSIMGILIRNEHEKVVCQVKLFIEWMEIGVGRDSVGKYYAPEYLNKINELKEQIQSMPHFAFQRLFDAAVEMQGKILKLTKLDKDPSIAETSHAGSQPVSTALRKVGLTVTQWLIDWLEGR